MKIAITGASGFIGTALLGAFAGMDIEILGHFDPQQFDVTDLAAMSALVRRADAVVHLAGPPSVAASLRDPLETVRAHVLGTATVLRAIELERVAWLVYVSSAEVYGSPDVARVDESQPLAPRSPYGAAKAGAEALVRAAWASQGTASYVVRPFSIYGPRMSPDALLASILSQAATSDEIVVRDLAPVRDYCFVGDLAELLVRAATRPPDGVVTLNAGFGRGYSVRQVVDEIGAAMGRSLVAMERGQKRPASVEIDRLVADVTEAREVLGWQACHDLRAGVRATIARTAAA